MLDFQNQIQIPIQKLAKRQQTQRKNHTKMTFIDILQVSSVSNLQNGCIYWQLFSVGKSVTNF